MLDPNAANPVARLLGGLVRGLVRGIGAARPEAPASARPPMAPDPGRNPAAPAAPDPLAAESPPGERTAAGAFSSLTPLDVGHDRIPFPRLPKGDYPVPHPQTFAALWNAVTRTYPTWRDEAQRNSRSDALAMRRDPFLEDLLSSRKRRVAKLKFHLEPDDPDDAGQRRACACLTKVVAATPRFRGLRNALLESIHFGRAAVQVAFKRARIDGQHRWVIGDPNGQTPGWEPVQGDKLVFKWDGTPGVLVHTGWAPDDVRRDLLERTDRGLALFLHDAEWRRHFIIHKYEPTDTDWLYETEQSGLIHGAGLRHRVYWAWFLRQEFLSYSTNGLQRISTNGQIVARYPAGNAQAQAEVLKALETLTQSQIAAFPFDQQNPEAYMLEHFDAGSVAYDVLQNWVVHFEDIIRRVYLGQTLSGKSEPQGLGGGGSDEAMEVLEDVTDGDADDLSETLTDDLLKPLIALNYGDLGFNVRLVLVNEQRDALKKMQSAKLLVDMGAQIDLDELIDEAGFKKAAAPSQAAVATPDKGSGGGPGDGPARPGDGLPRISPPAPRRESADRLAADWDESKVVRGQPENKGEFADKPGQSAALTPEGIAAINRWVADSRYRATPADRALIGRMARGSRTARPRLERVFSEDPGWSEGETIDLGPTATTGIAVSDGKSAGHIAWKSSDEALVLIDSPSRGLDVPYDRIKTPFDSASEAETIVAGRYRVKQVRKVVEPGTNPKAGYRVKQYVLEEIPEPYPSIGADRLRKPFDESKVVRGQPDNAGKFADKPAGSEKPKPRKAAKKAPAGANHPPAAA